MKLLIRRILLGSAVLLFPLSLFAATTPGGACPTGTGYLDPATNQTTTLAKLGVTSCYYVAANGSDSNSGTTETTPWAHAPGMATCTGNCAAVTPAAGMGFIFRGGDTWNYENYFVIDHGGSSSVPLYYGVDPSWFSGTAWNRPIFDIAGQTPNVNQYGESDIVDFNASWVTFDDWEFIHGTCTNGGGYNGGGISQNIFGLGDGYGISVTNSYFHEFAPPSNGCLGMTGDGNAAEIWVYEEVPTPAGCTSEYFEHNVIDGTDGTGVEGYAVSAADGPGGCFTVAYNVIHDLCSGITAPLAHDNVVGNFGGSIGKYECASPSHEHNHAMRWNADATYYNNVIYHTEGEVISVNPQSGGPGSYIYNNVLYANNASGIDVGDNGTTTKGSVYIFNNFVDAQTGGDFVFGNCINIENSVALISIHNEFHLLPADSTVGCIIMANSPFNQSSKGTASTLSYNAADDVNVTVTQANKDGRTASSIFAYAPTLSTDPAIGIGTPGIANEEALDATYACAEETVNGVVQAVCPARQPVARATNGSCTAKVAGCVDAGPYEYIPGLGTPAGLTGVLTPKAP